VETKYFFTKEEDQGQSFNKNKSTCFLTRRFLELVVACVLFSLKKRMQAQAVFGPNGEPYKNMVDCIATMLRKEGIVSFYRGLVPSVLKTTIATGLSFGFFRFTKNILEALDDEWRHDYGRSDDDVFDR